MDIPDTDGRAESGHTALISENRALRRVLAERDTRLAALAARLNERDDQLAERDIRLADLTALVQELQDEIRLLKKLPRRPKPKSSGLAKSVRGDGGNAGVRRRRVGEGRRETAQGPRPPAPEPEPAPPRGQGHP